MSTSLSLGWLLPAVWFGVASSLRGDTEELKSISELRTKLATTQVDLIITRHALSCANIVSTWKPPYGGMFANPLKSQAANRYVKDPILAAAGAAGSQAMGTWIKEKQQELKLDAVLASSLVRAVETAMLQYPGNKIYVTPYIREKGFDFAGASEGYDNLPQPLGWQKPYLTSAIAEADKSMKPTEIIDMHELMDAPAELAAKKATKGVSTDDLRSMEGDWPSFLSYLAQVWLPQFATADVLPEKMTLAVVTHSNFMRDSDDTKAHCSDLWANHPGSKPLNNQAVRLSYKYTYDEGFPQENKNGWSLEVITDAGTLKREHVCEEIAPGVNYKPGGNKRALCVRDIGDTCSALLKASGVDRSAGCVDDKFKEAALEYDKVASEEKKLTKEGLSANFLQALADQGSDALQNKMKEVQSSIQTMADKRMKLWSDVQAARQEKCILDDLSICEGATDPDNVCSMADEAKSRFEEDY